MSAPDAATNAFVTDPLPGSVTFVSASPGCSETLGTVTCTLGTINAAANKQATFTAAPHNSGLLTNTAQASSDTADPDNTKDRKSVV